MQGGVIVGINRVDVSAGVQEDLGGGRSAWFEKVWKKDLLLL